MLISHLYYRLCQYKREHFFHIQRNMKKSPMRGKIHQLFLCISASASENLLTAILSHFTTSHHDFAIKRLHTYARRTAHMYTRDEL